MQTIIQPATCINANQKIYTFCLPRRIECIEQPKTGRIVECGEQWNCNLPCRIDRIYHQPFVRGDKIQFQTVVFGGTPSNPMAYDDLFEVVICTNDSVTYPIEGNKMSAWKDGLPYQILELCTDNLPDCWSLEFTNRQTGEKCCTQEFGVVEDCKETILIQSKRLSRDCFGYCYGEPDSYTGDLIEYNNALRYCGWLKRTGWGAEIERADFSGQIKSEQVTENFQLTFNGKMPPFAANILCNQLLTGGNICIDNEDYNLESYNISNELTVGSMYKFSVDLQVVCISSAQNCDN